MIEYHCFGCRGYFQIEEESPPPNTCPLCKHEHVAKTTLMPVPPWVDELFHLCEELWKSRQFGIILAIVGLILIIFGVIQWTSLASQGRRALGDIDVLGISLFVGGAVALLLGSSSLASSLFVSYTPPTVTKSTEDRLRQLDDLRLKGLISDTEYEQRRKDIIASV